MVLSGKYKEHIERSFILNCLKGLHSLVVL